jgi:hypothetical protein
MQSVRALFGQVDTRDHGVPPQPGAFRLSGWRKSIVEYWTPRNRDEEAAVYSKRCNSAG